MNLENKALLNEEFLRDTIFVVCSPQEAVGLLLLSGGKAVHCCVLVSYAGHADEKYSDITRRILKEVKINKLLVLNLHLHNISMNRGDYFLCAKEIVNNIYEIRKFNQQYFDGTLFNCNYNFVTQIDSPLLTLSKYDLAKIYSMEHGFADSRARIRNKKKLDSKETAVNIFKTKLLILTSKPRRWREIFRRIGNRIFTSMLFWLFPLMKTLPGVTKGFSWIDYSDDFSLMDYRNSTFKFEFNIPSNLGDTCNKTLLLIDHKATYRDAPVYEEMKSIDFVDMYADILERYAHKNELIVCKFHPYITQCLDLVEIEAYMGELRRKFKCIGYRKVMFVNEILTDETLNFVPVELLLLPLKVNKIIGLYSSTMLIVQNWDGMTIVSACGRIQGLKRAREIDKEIFEMNFICD